MKWLTNFSLTMRSNITTLCEKFEDPERMLHQLLIDMEHELDRVRASVAGAIADEILLGKSVKQAQDEAQQWEERAGTALKRGDETSAKAALEQKVYARERADDLTLEHDKQKEQTEKLRQSVSDLETKIRQARQRQTLLLARLTRADSTTKINRAMEQSTSRSAFAQFGRLEKRADRAEAMSEAYDRLDGKDPDADELERNFAEADRQEKIADELEELTARVLHQD
jgi:phage shock protein A